MIEKEVEETTDRIVDPQLPQLLLEATGVDGRLSHLGPKQLISSQKSLGMKAEIFTSLYIYLQTEFNLVTLFSLTDVSFTRSCPVASRPTREMMFNYTHKEKRSPGERKIRTVKMAIVHLTLLLNLNPESKCKQSLHS